MLIFDVVLMQVFYYMVLNGLNGVYFWMMFAVIFIPVVVCFVLLSMIRIKPTLEYEDEDDNNELLETTSEIDMSEDPSETDMSNHVRLGKLLGIYTIFLSLNFLGNVMIITMYMKGEYSDMLTYISGKIGEQKFVKLMEKYAQK